MGRSVMGCHVMSMPYSNSGKLFRETRLRHGVAGRARSCARFARRMDVSPDSGRRRRGRAARRRDRAPAAAAVLSARRGISASVTFGLLLILEDVIRLLWGGLPLSAEPV